MKDSTSKGVVGKTASFLPQLLEAKRRSDARDYDAKHRILRKIIAERPDEFEIDSRKGNIYGLTHHPTGFRIHAPTQVVQPLRKQAFIIDDSLYRSYLAGTASKHASDLIAAGLAVLAKDTGRVLMLQRAFNDDDPAGGMFEFPGGHIEENETPLQAAKREWEEETGFRLPRGRRTGEWTSEIYRGYVWEIDKEAMIDLALPQGEGNRKCFNPDNPDLDYFESMVWMEPTLMVSNPSLRTELRRDMRKVQGAIRGESAGYTKKASHYGAGDSLYQKYLATLQNSGIETKSSFRHNV